MDVDEATFKYLWEKQKIGIHFPQGGKENTLKGRDNSSINPEDYIGSGRRAITTLGRLSKDGGYVLAEYAHRSNCLVGKVEPNTRIELYSGKWGTVWNLQGREAILKTLQLTCVKEIPANQSVALLVGRPKMGTVLRWPNSRDTVMNLVEGKVGLPSLSSLSPTLQEVLCSEYLRLPTEQTGLPQLAHLILPVGRTMRDLDLYGIDTNGIVIAAQITLQSSAACDEKMKKLAQYKGENVRCIFFCTDKTASTNNGISYYPLDDAYSKFVATPTGKRWIAETLRY